MPPPLVFLVAGEPSGDSLGAGLMRGLLAESAGAVEFTGVGGPEMEAEGLASLFPMSDIAVMGIAEVVPALARVLGRLRQTVRAVRDARPSVLVTIDSQAFSRRLARRLHPAPFPVVHYVAPTVWAWRPGRARKLAAVTDRLLLLFPFEKPWWDRVGQDSVHVGHPVADMPLPDGIGALRSSLVAKGKGPLLAVLPGSRRSEVARHLPLFRDAVGKIVRDLPHLVLVIPTVASVAADVREGTRSWPWPLAVVEGGGRRAAMAAADAALAVSGTVALELASVGTPHVIAYRAHPLTAAIVRRLITVEHASLVNLSAGEEVTPEFLQERCRADLLHDGIRRLLVEPPARSRQQRLMADVMQALRHPRGPSSRVAARSILEML